MASWSDLPPELLALTISKLLNPADRLRSHAVCRAVCRAWHYAVRHHHAATAHQRLPWIMLIQDGYFMDPSDGSTHRLPSFPDDGILIGGCTDGWLLLGQGRQYIDDHARQYQLDSYLLHNPFSRKSVPLPELDAASRIRKFAMRSSNDDLVAVLTSDRKCPLVIFRPGKGAWLADPHADPFIYTIDLAFLGDKLYGITKADDLFSLDLALDDNGTPMAMNCKWLITHGYHGYDAWTDNDDDSNDQETKEHVITLRNLVESRGKLLMVRRHLLVCKGKFTRQVDVFEADTKNGMWLPLPIGSGLGGGWALFIDTRIGFSKSVSAPHGEVEEDTIYYINTEEVFNMKSRTCMFPRWVRRPPHGMAWLFTPELVL